MINYWWMKESQTNSSFTFNEIQGLVINGKTHTGAKGIHTELFWSNYDQREMV
jgi:hypothetical protein